MLINLEEAGDLGTRQDDVLLLGKCDDIIKELAEELGWIKELKATWAETRTSLDNPPPADEESEEELENKVPEAETEEEKLQREIDLLIKSVDESLRVTDDLKIRVGKEVEKDVAKTVHPPAETGEAGNLKKGGSNL